VLGDVVCFVFDVPFFFGDAGVFAATPPRFFFGESTKPSERGEFPLRFDRDERDDIAMCKRGGIRVALGVVE
jgi:hypothetical protein